MSNFFLEIKFQIWDFFREPAPTVPSVMVHSSLTVAYSQMGDVRDSKGICGTLNKELCAIAVAAIGVIQELFSLTVDLWLWFLVILFLVYAVFMGILMGLFILSLQVTMWYIRNIYPNSPQITRLNVITEAGPGRIYI